MISIVVLLLALLAIGDSLDYSELSADELYDSGLQQITGIYRRYKTGYKFIADAAEKGHQGAVVQLGIAHLFGDYLSFNFTLARNLLESVAQNNTDAQFFLGFMYSLGLGVNSSQAKALTYYTFAALGGNTYAEMSLAYRQLYHINTPLNCEQALVMYSKVAEKVASEITLSSGPIIQRITINNEGTGPDQSSFQTGVNRASVIIDRDTLAYYELMADRGETHAQLGLGTLYYTGGRGIKPNFKKALYHLTKAADKGSHSARAIMGKIYAQGDETVKSDPKMAMHHLRKAGEKNEPVAWAALGAMYYHGIGFQTDFKLAFQYLKMAAEANQVDAIVWLGTMYFYGFHVEKNIPIAIQYFTHATQAGHVLGPYYLALIHEIGMGVLRNCETSARLFKSVAERGRWSMSFMDAYYDFQGKRYDQAVMKYLLLSELGFEIAQMNAAVLLENGKTRLFGKPTTTMNSTTKPASPTAHSMAFSQFLRAAEQGHAASRVRVGDYYYYGFGGVCPIDMMAACTQYQIAATVGNDAQAMFNLGYMHENGLGYEKDFHLAKRWYDQAKDTNVDAVLPVVMAILKLYVRRFLGKSAKLAKMVAPSNNLFSRVQALHVGSALSGVLIIVVMLWLRPGVF